ncbi:MAG: DciA family protein [Burkholderiales bacterium]|nr:DciA family protein [Burkholderiales bacterium]
MIVRALEIGAAARLCSSYLPSDLARRVRAVNLKDGQLVVLAATPAAAAKLRLLAEGLCKFLSNEGLKVNGVSVRVQPALADAERAPAAARKLSAPAREALCVLYRRMPDSPARRALKSLLDHDLRRAPGEADPGLPPAPPPAARS